MAERIAIVGAGSWGTALGIALARNSHQVVLWSQEAKDVESMNRHRENRRYLPGIVLPENLCAQADLLQAIQGAHYIVAAIPSHAVCKVFKSILPNIPKHIPILIAAKGVDPDSNLLMPLAFAAICPSDQPLAVIAGPTFAREVALAMPTAMAIAARDLNLAQKVAALFHQPSLRPYINSDVIGTALGGAVKNVIAVAVGMADGLGFGANARSALITRGLAEMVRLGKAIGAQPTTLFGLAGAGDLILTCTDQQSRNRRFGVYLGQGCDAETAGYKVGQVVEGASNAIKLAELANAVQVDMPIVNLVYRILEQGLSAEQAADALLARGLKEDEFC